MAARGISIANVASGDTASAAFAVGGKRPGAKAMIFFPLLTSCQVTLEVAAITNPTSADFFKVHSPFGSGQFVAYPGAGAIALAVDPLMIAAPAARVVMSVAQAAPRSLQIVAEA